MLDSALAEIYDGGRRTEAVLSGSRWSVTSVSTPRGRMV